METEFAISLKRLKNRDLRYIITYCKNKALKELIRGKSIDSKHRTGIDFVDWLEAEERIPDHRPDPARIAVARCLIKKVEAVLTGRERLVWHLRADGYTEAEIGKRLGVSGPRVCQLVSRIRRKAEEILKNYP